ncbi:hypothetical protein BU14_0319s0020 [Porphyra umbilicalis]|uniref:Uncharacterized protein n=1 Tax=Porphyra umbilicalis TaxID=2786 RepID=A0A1X6NZA5_PORUM|nr:hypothetical protein BU14_0319s0020 [Porphyra umbilicalis]|eukprot:OSX73932.1 hypothetical protein BU14_0319s0020 [Porphyra umbilicalis]
MGAAVAAGGWGGGADDDGAALRPTALVFVLHDADGGAVEGGVAGADADAARVAGLADTLRADVARLWVEAPKPGSLVGVPLSAVFLVSVVGLPHPRYRALESGAALAQLRARLHGAVPAGGVPGAHAAAVAAAPSASAAGPPPPSLLPRECSKQLPSHAAAMMVGMAWRAVLEADGAAAAAGGGGGGGGGGGALRRRRPPVAAAAARALHCRRGRRPVGGGGADQTRPRGAAARAAAPPPPDFGATAAAAVLAALTDFDRSTGAIGAADRPVVAAKRAGLVARLDAAVRPAYFTALRRSRAASLDGLRRVLASGAADPGTPAGAAAATAAGAAATAAFAANVRSLAPLTAVVPGLSAAAAGAGLDAAIAEALARHPSSAGVGLRAAAALERESRRRARRAPPPGRTRGGRAGLHLGSAVQVAGGGSWTAAVVGAPGGGILSVTGAAANDGVRAEGGGGGVPALTRRAQAAARLVPPRVGGALLGAAAEVTAARVQPTLRVDADL